jgi:MoaA/NifB/PqqE/SkfB family radical SAM enzyme
LRNVQSEGLSFPEIIKMIKKLSREGIFEFSIGGGEPLCYPKIKEILLFSTRRMYTLLTTNGTLLNEELINFFKKLPNFSLQISLDGNEKHHRKIRNMNRMQYLHLINAIKECVSQKINLKIGFMLSRLNLNSLDYICRFCIKEKINSLHILPYIGEDKKFQLKFSDFLKSAKIIKKYISQLKITIRDPFLQFLVFEKLSYCEAGFTFNIDYQGNVSPCCYMEKKEIGNIFNLRIKDIPKICEEKFEISNRHFCPVQEATRNVKFLRAKELLMLKNKKFFDNILEISSFKNRLKRLNKKNKTKEVKNEEKIF